MSHEDRQDYYWRRAREARDLAAVATDERARLAHVEMAARYERLASGGAADDPSAMDDADD